MKAIECEGEFNFIDPESGAKVDFWLAEDNEWSRSQLDRRRPEIVDGQKIYFISPEDLVLSKLLWYKQSESSRDVEDASFVLKISGEKLNKKYIKQWAKKLGVESTLRKIELN